MADYKSKKAALDALRLRILKTISSDYRDLLINNTTATQDLMTLQARIDPSHDKIASRSKESLIPPSKTQGVFHFW
jgi:hypothetical protein